MGPAQDCMEIAKGPMMYGPTRMSRKWTTVVSSGPSCRPLALQKIEGDSILQKRSKQIYSSIRIRSREETSRRQVNHRP